MPKRIVIVDYGCGNLFSLANAVKRVSPLSASITVADQPDEVAKADYLILPGVGAFAACRRGLASIQGLEEAVLDHAQMKAKPFLGICVGMQLLADVGEEDGEHQGLGLIAGRVKRLPSEAKLPIPHIGWQRLSLTQAEDGNDTLALSRGGELVKSLAGAWVYFVHSYVFHPWRQPEALASFDFGGPTTAMVGRDNLIATQFHPEKSQAVGLNFLANFLNWRPA